MRDLLNEFVSEEAVVRAGVFDWSRLHGFLDAYQQDGDPVSLVRKDALLNHIIGLQILHHQFIEQNESPDMEPVRPIVEQATL